MTVWNKYVYTSIVSNQFCGVHNRPNKNSLFVGITSTKRTFGYVRNLSYGADKKGQIDIKTRFDLQWLAKWTKRSVASESSITETDKTQINSKIEFILQGSSVRTFGYARILNYTGAWWRHQMKSFSALLALCAGNSPVAGEFPSQTPVMRSFDVCFDLRLN